MAAAPADLPWLRYGTGFLEPLESLKALSLEGCQLAHAQLAVLAGLTNLTSLNITW